MAVDTINLIQAFILGFTIGISAALVPGPMMLATISISLKKGWKTGLYVFGGHSIVETSLFLLIIMGLSTVLIKDILPYIAIIGGLVMVLFGAFIISRAKEASTIDINASATKFDVTNGPVYAGIVTSALNPTLLLWWLTAGSAIILQQYMLGIYAVIAFVIGHWIADLGFLVFVSSSFSKGKDFLSTRTHKWLIYICGVFLIFIGVFFLVEHNSFL